MNSETKLFGGIILATVALIAGAIFFLSGKPSASTVLADQKLLVRDDSFKTATGSSKVTLVEFGDYQCPACSLYHPMVKALLEKYKDSLMFVFREYPLPMHQYAPISAAAAVAAGRQGKYWEMHTMLYERQSEWSTGTDAREKIVGYAKEIGLSMDQFTRDLDSKEVKDFIDRDVADGEALSVNATPTFYINRKKVENVGTLGEFESLIQAELTK